MAGPSPNDSLRVELEAALASLADLPETVNQAVAGHAKYTAAVVLRSVLVGAGVAALVLFLVFGVGGPERLSVERHVWAVATDAEREEIREILFRSSAPLPLVHELTGELAPRLLVERPPEPPVVMEPPRRLVEPPDLPPAVPIPEPEPAPCREEPPPATHPFADTP